VLDSCCEEANAVLHMASSLFLLMEQREMDKRHAVCGSRSAALVSVMKSTDLRYRANLAFAWRLDRAG